MKNKSRRQVVTGIIVNEIKNVPKEYIREVRAMLYSWEKYGLDKAEVYWRTKVDKRNRATDLLPRFRWVVRGKIAHIAAVKGKIDPVYLQYAKRLAKLDTNYSLDTKAIASSIASEIRIFVEGKTDTLHLSSALEYFHSNGEFTNIKLIFPENKNGDASTIVRCGKTD